MLSKEEQPKEPIVVEPVDFNTFLDTQYPEAAYIVDRLVIRGGLNMITGDSGVGKTFLSLEYMIQLASGGKVFGEFSTQDPMSVLLVNEEDTARSLHNRLECMTTLRDLPIHFLMHNGYKIDNEDVTSAILMKAVMMDIKVIIFDNLTQIHDLNENSAQEINRVIGQMKRFTAEGITVIILHHNRKDNGLPTSAGGNIRGSSVLRGSMDTHINVELVNDPDKFLVTMRQTKNKEDEIMRKPFSVELVKDKGRFSWQYRGVNDDSMTALERAQNEIKSLFDNEGTGFYRSIKELTKMYEKSIGRDTLNKALKNLVGANVLSKRTRGEVGLYGTKTEHVYGKKDENQKDFFGEYLYDV